MRTLLMLLAIIASPAWADAVCTPIVNKLTTAAQWCVDPFHYGSTYCDAANQQAFHEYFLAIVHPGDPSSVECSCIQNSPTDTGCNWTKSNPALTCADWTGVNTVGLTGTGTVNVCPAGYTEITSGPNAGKCNSDLASGIDAAYADAGMTTTKDASGTITSVTQKTGVTVTVTQRDSKGRPTQYTDPDGLTATVTYYPDSNTVYSRTKNGVTRYNRPAMPGETLQDNGVGLTDGGPFPGIVEAGTMALMIRGAGIAASPSPAGLVSLAGLTGWAIGSEIYPVAEPLLSKAVDAVCNVIKSDSETPEQRASRCMAQYDADARMCEHLALLSTKKCGVDVFDLKDPNTLLYCNPLPQSPNAINLPYTDDVFYRTLKRTDNCWASRDRRLNQCILGQPIEPLDTAMPP